jgi:hypothetical protein
LETQVIEARRAALEAFVRTGCGLAELRGAASWNLFVQVAPRLCHGAGVITYAIPM